MNTTNLLPPRNFNPRSHKGSDNIDTLKLTPSQIFQSTLPQGERRSHFPAMSQYRLEFQSTLPQGERPYNKVMSGATSYFNPRSHKGSDVVLGSQEPQKQAISIHAPTRGATFCTGHYNILHCNFNPRSHKGSDVPLISPYFQTSNISIHAPTRGATAILHKIPYLFYFIFTNPFPISYFHTQPASDF